MHVLIGLYVLSFSFETAESIIEGGDGSESEHQAHTAACNNSDWPWVEATSIQQIVGKAGRLSSNYKFGGRIFQLKVGGRTSTRYDSRNDAQNMYIVLKHVIYYNSKTKTQIHFLIIHYMYLSNLICLGSINHHTNGVVIHEHIYIILKRTLTICIHKYVHT